MADPRPPLISPNSVVPLTVVVTAVLMTVAVMAKLNAIENAIANLQSDNAFRWTSSNMETWIDKTSRRNPTFDLPSVSDVKARH